MFVQIVSCLIRAIFSRRTLFAEDWPWEKMHCTSKEETSWYPDILNYKYNNSIIVFSVRSIHHCSKLPRCLPIRQMEFKGLYQYWIYLFISKYKWKIRKKTFRYCFAWWSWEIQWVPNIIINDKNLLICPIYLTDLAGADLDHVTYILWRTKIMTSCSKSFKTVEVLVLILIFIQMWRTRKSFLNPPLLSPIRLHCFFFQMIPNYEEGETFQPDSIEVGIFSSWI